MSDRRLSRLEIGKMALRSLGGHRLRSALTVAGVMVGVFSVIGVMTVVGALREQIENGLSSMGANTFQITRRPQGIIFGGVNWDKIRKRRAITLRQGQDYIAGMQGWVSRICLTIYDDDDDVRAGYGNRQTDPNLDYGGTDENFVFSRQYQIEFGRNFTPEDIAEKNPVTILGQSVVATLFPAENPLGKTVVVNGHAYTVIGTFAHKGTAFGQNEDAIAMVPISRFVQDNGSRGNSIQIATEAPTQESYDAVMEHGVTVMRAVRGVPSGGDSDFEVSSNDSLVAAFANVADVVSEGALIISGIALVAAGVGIMNIMLVSVTERTNEIGVRKSLGARKADILSQFLAEAVALSLTGGLSGIVLGVIVGNAAALALHATIIFPWGWALTGLGVCASIGIGFGFYPALRAAGLDPIEALRYE